MFVRLRYTSTLYVYVIRLRYPGHVIYIHHRKGSLENHKLPVTTISSLTTMYFFFSVVYRCKCIVYYRYKCIHIHVCINIYSYSYHFTYTVYTVRAYAYYCKDSLESFPSKIFPFFLDNVSLFLSFSLSNKRGIKKSFRLVLF